MKHRASICAKENTTDAHRSGKECREPAPRNMEGQKHLYKEQTEVKCLLLCSSFSYTVRRRGL